MSSADTLEDLKHIHWQISGSSASHWPVTSHHHFTGIEGNTPQVWHFPKQVHGTRIIVADDRTRTDSRDRPEADGIFTAESRVSIAVQTADCLPILFQHTQGVMAVHAGWRGLTAGILQNAADFWWQQGIDPVEVAVVIGPAISLTSFEVGYEVIEAYLKCPIALDPHLKFLPIGKGKDDRWHLDLPVSAVLQLLCLGFKPERITVLQQCTFQQSTSWHSYRRDGTRSGRNWAWITKD